MLKCRHPQLKNKVPTKDTEQQLPFVVNKKLVDRPLELVDRLLGVEHQIMGQRERLDVRRDRKLAHLKELLATFRTNADPAILDEDHRHIADLGNGLGRVHVQLGDDGCGDVSVCEEKL